MYFDILIANGEIEIIPLSDLISGVDVKIDCNSSGRRNNH